MYLLVFMFSFSVIKMLVIFIYFFIINLTYNIFQFIIHLFKKRCMVNCSLEIKESYEFLVKIIKKFYTYNFYSFENKLFGWLIVPIYILYLLFNIEFSTGFINKIQDKNYQDRIDIIMNILAFEFNLFIEIICVTMYITRNFKKQFIIIISSFVGLNLLVIITVFIKFFYKLLPLCPILQIVLRILFTFYFLIFFGISIICIKRYNLNCV